jgi:uncharacterized membrane protein YdjX (TVP38/TMEM64 family)
MQQYGIAIGVVLLVLGVTCAFLLARKAASSVRRFREETHQRFTGKEPT